LEAKLIFQFIMSVVVPVFAYLKAVLYLHYTPESEGERNRGFFRSGD
jgi:hypothetical protein